MPQFDTAHFLPQLFWFFVAFAILYFGVVKMTLPKIGRVVDEREKVIGDDLGAAETAQDATEKAEQAYQSGLADARSEALDVVGAAKSSGAQETEARLSVANAEIADKIAVAEARIGEARSAALAELDDVAATATADIVERLTGKRPSDADAKVAVGSAT